MRHALLAAVLAAAVTTAACGDTDLRGYQPENERLPVPGPADTTLLPADSTLAPAAAPAAPADPPGAPQRPAAPATRGAPATGERAAAAPARPSERRRITFGGMDLTGIGHDKGDPSAPVVIINFSDFGCPYCALFSLQTYPELEREYVATGKVFYKYVPFVMGMFPNAREAARGAECAADQGRFWAMHDRLYEGQRSWKGARDPQGPLAELAQRAGLDAGQFAACMADQRTDPRTRRASDAASRLGVRATPSFAVNDRGIEGALPLADFRRVIEAALLVEESRAASGLP